MNPTPSEILKSHPVFASLPGTVLSRLASLAMPRQYRTGEAVARTGDVWEYLFLVAEGSLKAVKESMEGRSLTVAQVGSGDIFWGLGFFQQGVGNPVTLVCTQPVSLLLWSRIEILPILLENGSLTWEIARMMVERMVLASEVIEGLAFQPVAGRLARLLLEDFKSAGDDSISRHLTLDEMAARVGSTREMVCRALYRFADLKLIDVTRTEFVLKDRDGLHQVADAR